MRYALLFSWLCFNLCAQAAKQPDIVFFLIDDLGYADCGFNGGKEIKTPNIDRLAQSGAIIENHYVQPVCSPTRSTLLTGRYPTHTGVYTIVSAGVCRSPNVRWPMPCARPAIAPRSRGSGTSVNSRKPTSPTPAGSITSMATSSGCSITSPMNG